MSDTLLVILAGIFLPLFPMSMLFNAVIDKTTNALARSIIIVVWPLCGVVIVSNITVAQPIWLVPLVLFTSTLYAVRILTLRDVTQWTGFLATSLWALLWIPVLQGTSAELLYSYAVSMALPLMLLVTLSTGLQKRFGAAYTDLYGGLARTIPRFSGVLVVVVVAAVATPVFPSFFILFDIVVETIATEPAISSVLLLNWLLWSWAGARLIQGLIVGRASQVKILDMAKPTVGLYAIVLLGLAAGGLYMSGEIL